MNDFMNKVQQLVKVWNAAAAEGLDITNQVADKIRILSVNLLTSDKFYVRTSSGTTVEMPVLNAEEIGYCKSNKKLEAVKCYRARSGYALMESKQAIDQYCRNKGL